MTVEATQAWFEVADVNAARSKPNGGSMEMGELRRWHRNLSTAC